MKDNDLIFFLFCGAFGFLILLVLHMTAQKRIYDLYLQCNELEVVVKQLARHE